MEVNQAGLNRRLISKLCWLRSTNHVKSSILCIETYSFAKKLFINVLKHGFAIMGPSRKDNPRSGNALIY